MPVSRSVTLAVLSGVALFSAVPAGVKAGPLASVARQCMSYSYIAYPYKRPGSVRMSGDRQAYFKSCMAKDGRVARPVKPD